MYQLKSHLKLEKNGRCSRGIRAGNEDDWLAITLNCVVSFLVSRAAEAPPKWVPYGKATSFRLVPRVALYKIVTRLHLRRPSP